jgi:dTDP-4-amino-4,6-dideoxygalactose transaminase
MPVHLAGAPADVEAFRQYGVPLVEDAAQAHGARWNGRSVGTLGDAACFSFQSSKAMTAGEGGLIVTDDEQVYRRLWAFHNVGRSLEGGWYEHPDVGWNLRMTEFQAAVLIPQLAALDEQIAKRERAVGFLRKQGLDILPEPAGTTRSSHHLALLRYAGSRSKADFIAAMTAEGIPLDSGYRSLSRENALRAYTELTPCPVGEAAEDSIVWIRQSLLMADEEDLADIVTAMVKVRQAF